MVIDKRKNTKKDTSTEPKERYIGFATNLPGGNINRYPARWGIETGYGLIEDETQD